MSDLFGAPIVAADRFPVRLTGAVEHAKVRAILTQPTDGVGQFHAWLSPENKVLETAFYVEESVFGGRARDWVVATDAGQVGISSLGGCGCGDRLKSFIPWHPYQIGRPLR